MRSPSYSSHHRRTSRRTSKPFWRPSPRLSAWSAQLDYLTLGVLLVLIAAGGGSAFADTLSLLYVRLAAVVALMVFLLTSARLDWRSHRMPLAMLAVLAAIIGAQLVPLPPSIWTMLPGRTPYLEAATALGLPQSWRPLSLTPDLTANSLISLIVPATVLIGFAKLTIPQREQLLLGFLLLCLASIALGVAQFGGGGNSTMYFYKRTYEGMPVGLLANRNHQAALLATFFPALRVWTLLPASSQRWAQRRMWLALAFGVITVPVLLATGSRAGILLGLAGLAASFLLFPAGRRRRDEMASPMRGLQAKLLKIGVPVLLILLVLATWQFGRALSIQRLTGGAPAIQDDLRFQFAPLVTDIIWKTFPVGTGFGSFDPVFRQYEPDAALKNSYFNHAHNELLELAMTAGVAGMALLIVFAVWLVACIAGALRDGSRSPARRYVLLGGAITSILLAASIVDYPLRTPLLGAWFAIACGWLCARRAEQAG